MYDAHQVIAHLDHNKWKIIALCALAMVCNYTWFIAAFRVARRERVYSVPAFCTLFWLVGDSSFLWHFDRWFHYYKNWYVELFWFALVLTVLFELAFTVQLIQYGREELLPAATQAQFAALVLAAIGAAIVIWSMIRHVINDALWITYFDLANLVGPIFAAALIVKRRSAAGQTTVIWYAYAAMAALWFIAESLWFGPVFRSSEYFAVAILCVGASLAVAYTVGRLRRPATEAAPQLKASRPLGWPEPRLAAPRRPR